MTHKTPRERYADWVLLMHQLATVDNGHMPMCSCGSPAILCPYRTQAAKLGLPPDLPPPPPRPRPRPTTTPAWRDAWNAHHHQPP